MITERRRHVAESRVCEAPALGTHARLGRAHVDRPAVITVPVQRHKKEPAHVLRSTLYSSIIPSRGTAPLCC
jgi:hypothetical protein